MKKFAMALLAIASIASVGGIISLSSSIEERQAQEYEYALSLYLDEDYFAAYREFDKFNDYKNAQEYKELCIDALERIYS